MPNPNSNLNSNPMKKLLRTFKTGADLNFRVVLSDKDLATGIKTPVDISAENLIFECSIFDHKLKLLAVAAVEPSQTDASLFSVHVPKSVTQKWLPTIAQFDFKVTHSVSGQVIYSKTIEFEVERGLS